MFRFEKLEVWQKALKLADDVYAVTRSFPADERFLGDLLEQSGACRFSGLLPVPRRQPHVEGRPEDQPGLRDLPQDRVGGEFSPERGELRVFRALLAFFV